MGTAIQCDQCGKFSAAREISPRIAHSHRAVPTGWLLLNVWHGHDASGIPADKTSDVFGEFCSLGCAASYLTAPKAAA